MYTPILYSLIAASLHYLGSRAVITRWLWSRYPSWLASWTSCASCSGFWFGLAIALVLGRRYELTYMGLDGLDPLTPLVVAFCSVAATPIVAGLMHWGFYQIGDVAPVQDEDATTPPGNGP